MRAETMHQEHPFFRIKIWTPIRYKEKRNAMRDMKTREELRYTEIAAGIVTKIKIRYAKDNNA
jgi:hypothetical protein